MAKVQDVAEFFIDLAQKQFDNGLGDLVTNLRLQKLLYFAQGWHLARYGVPLFDNEMLAWQYGPVVPEIYSKYAHNGSGGIPSSNSFSSEVFTSDEYALLLDVAREYDRHATSILVNISHRPDGPWAATPQKQIIDKGDIRTYFANERPLQCFDDIMMGRTDIVTPERDEEGIAVFSADMDDDWGDDDAD